MTDILNETWTKENKGIKFDSGKNRLELVPTSAMLSLGKVFTFGAKKYAENTWQNVERERYVGALLRHLMAYIDEPDGTDLESGLLHIEHVLWNAAALNDFAVKNQLRSTPKNCDKT